MVNTYIYLYMYRTWRACYIADKNPMHVILVTGLNDVVRVPPEGFETVLQAWYHELFDLHPASTIRMCTLMRTPSQCRFHANGPLPVPGYVTYLEKVNQINVVIDKFNRRVGNGSILGFGCEGCRGKKAEVSCRGPSIRFLAGERRVEGQGTACISRRRRGLR